MRRRLLAVTVSRLDGEMLKPFPPRYADALDTNVPHDEGRNAQTGRGEHERRARLVTRFSLLIINPRTSG